MSNVDSVFFSRKKIDDTQLSKTKNRKRQEETIGHRSVSAMMSPDSSSSDSSLTMSTPTTTYRKRNHLPSSSTRRSISIIEDDGDDGHEENASASSSSLVEQRRRLLENGRADVDGLLRDISKKYSRAIYQRDLEINQLRRQITSLETELEESKAAIRLGEELKQKLEQTVSLLNTEAVASAKAMAEQRSLLKETEAKHDEALRQSKETIATLEDRISARKAGQKAATSAVEEEIAKLKKELSEAKAKAKAAEVATKEERRRSDHYFRALKHSESETADMLKRIEHLTHNNDRSLSREWLEESLRLQMLNTKRLLSVLAFIGHSDEGARTAKSIGKTVHALGAGQFQFVDTPTQMATAAAGGGVGAGGKSEVMNGGLTAPATVLQDIQMAIASYNEAEGAMARRCLPLQSSSRGLLGSAEPFWSLHTEKDRWVPSEAVAVIRYFQQKHFPNARPDIFYGLLMQISTLLRDLCGLSPADKLIKTLEEKELEALRRYGYHNNNLNAPFNVNAHTFASAAKASRNGDREMGLDFTKQSFPKHSANPFYYSERVTTGALGQQGRSGAAVGGGGRQLNALEEVRLTSIAKAVEGLLLLRRNMVSSGGEKRASGGSSFTSVTLTHHTCEELCGSAIAALEDCAAAIRNHAAGGVWSEGGRYTNTRALLNGGERGEAHSDNPYACRLSAALGTMNNLFGSIQDASSHQLEYLAGISDAAAHLKDALRVLISDIERSRRSAATTNGGASPRVAVSADDISVSGPYAILKSQVSQAVERYVNEIRTIVKAAEGRALATREKATRHYHKGLVRSGSVDIGVGPIAQ